MAKAMTSRERLRAVHRWEEPDTVPVCPDVLIMYPAKLTGRPFWEVYYREQPPLWRAYLEVVRRFGLDGLFYCSLDAPRGADAPAATQELVETSPSGLTVRHTVQTPAGPLLWHVFYPPDSPAVRVQGEPEDLDLAIAKALSLFVDPWPLGTSSFERVRAAFGEECALGSAEGHDPFGWWVGFRGLAQAILDVCDYPEKMAAAFGEYTRWSLERVAATCEKLRPDEIRCGGATSSMSCISPSIYLRFNLPHIKRVTAVARGYGVPVNLHL